MELKDELLIRLSDSSDCELSDIELAEELECDVKEVESILAESSFWDELNKKIIFDMKRKQPLINRSLLGSCLNGKVEAMNLYYKKFCDMKDNINIKFGDLSSLEDQKFDEIYKARVKFLEENNKVVDI